MTLSRMYDRQNSGHTPLPPRPAKRICLLQIALRRPPTRLMTRTIRPITRSKWIRPPPICRVKPRSHKIMRATKIVQSISTSLLMYGAHPNTNRFRRTGRQGCDGMCRHFNVAKWQNEKQRQSNSEQSYFLLFSLAFSSAFPSATACAFAPRTSARKGWATAGTVTLPKSRARVVAVCP